MKNNGLLALLQLSDSALPLGAYSHSFGLETFVQNGIIVSAETCLSALRTLLTSSIAPMEGAAAAIAYRLAAKGDMHALSTLNDHVSAARWTKETHAASLSMGDRLRRLAHELSWSTSLPAGELHHFVAFACLAHAQQIPQDAALSAYLFSSAAQLVYACVRLVPLGHTEGQRILTSLRPLAEDLSAQYIDSTIDDLSTFAPLHEWACVEHETLYSRLFQS